MFLLVLLPICLIRFIVFVPFGYYWAHAKTHWDVIEFNPVLSHGGRRADSLELGHVRLLLELCRLATVVVVSAAAESTVHGHRYGHDGVFGQGDALSDGICAA
jgi:hypothetical protein